MKYMLMIMTDEKAEAALSAADVEQIVQRHGAFGRELRAAGKYVDSYRLRFSSEATTLRRHGDRWVPTDGPFAECKEQLGGFYLIEAETRDEAIAWAKKLPLRDVGAIEVRPARTGAQWRDTIRGAHKFLLLFIVNRDTPPSREEVFRSIDCHYELSLTLAAQGRFVGSRALEPTATAATLRCSNGTHVVSDGPFAETKEFVGGYFVIACDSRPDALRWAEQLAYGNAACEVRPIWED